MNNFPSYEAPESTRTEPPEGGGGFDQEAVSTAADQSVGTWLRTARLASGPWVGAVYACYGLASWSGNGEP